MITGNSGVCFLVQKWTFRDTYVFFFQKNVETPTFMVVLGVRAFLGPSCQKRKFWTPTPKNEKFD